MQINHKSKEFALGLFSTDYDRYYIPEFVTCLGLRGAAYKLFRMIYFYTERRINTGYVTYARGEICKGLKVSRITVDRAFSTLQKKGLIICEMVQRDGKVYRGYRVDKDDIWRRIDEAKNQSCAAAIYKAPSERELAPKVTEGERGTSASAITTLAAARSPHGSGTLSSIHYRSAASLPVSARIEVKKHSKRVLFCC